MRPFLVFRFTKMYSHHLSKVVLPSDQGGGFFVIHDLYDILT